MEGRTIADRYRLIRLLGKGGMGSVWLGEHLSLKNDVAIKIIDSELARNPEARARFAREAQLAARIKSPHVVRIFDHGMTDDGLGFIAMECLSGMSLRDRLLARQRLTLAETARMLSHVCRALARAHEAGLVHRDLKPENVFVAREGDDEIIKVLDFGIAKATDALANSGIDPTRTGALLGTPYYMSPEQAQGLKTVDYRTDLWAAGVLVFECLTGVRPFSAEALGPLIAKILGGPIPVPSAAAPDAGIPHDVDAWMMHALARDPAKRFASAKELSEAFMVASGSAESMQRASPARVPAAAGSGPSVSPSGSAAAAHVATPSWNEDSFAKTVANAAANAGPNVSASSPAAAVASLTPPSSTMPLGAMLSGPPAAVAIIARSDPPRAPSRVPWIIAVVVLASIVVVLAFIVVTRH
jgi:serine/threonine-protein kinase